MRIYLVGFMGSGKSTLGRAVAQHFQVPFFGTDEEIEAKEQMSVYDIFIDKGEYYFRELENEILKASATQPLSIVATGGGLPCHDDNMEWILQHGISIYLEWPIAKIITQLRNEVTTRPILAGFAPEHRERNIEALFNQRLPFYERAALTIEMTGDIEKDTSALIKACRYIW